MEVTSNLSSYLWQTSHLSQVSHEDVKGLLHVTWRDLQLITASSSLAAPLLSKLYFHTGLDSSLLCYDCQNHKHVFQHFPIYMFLEHSTEYTPEVPSCFRGGCSKAAPATRTSACLQLCWPYTAVTAHMAPHHLPGSSAYSHHGEK